MLQNHDVRPGLSLTTSGATAYVNTNVYELPQTILFPRLAGTVGNWLVGFKGGLDGGFLLSPSFPAGIQFVPVTHGNYCVAVREADAGAFWVAAVMVEPGVRFFWRRYRVSGTSIDLDGGDREIPPEIAGTSQGFLDLTAAGDPVWTDLNRVVEVYPGVPLVLPEQRGDYLVGQAIYGGEGVQVWRPSQKKLYWAFHGETQLAPRVSEDGRAAVSADPGGIFAEAQWEEQSLPTYTPFTPCQRATFLGCYPDNDAHLKNENCTLTLQKGTMLGTFTTQAGEKFLWYDIEQGKLQGFTPEQQLQNHPYGSIAYVGFRQFPDWVPSLMQPGEGISVAFYLNPREDPAKLVADVDAIAAKCKTYGLDLFITGQAWNRGTCTDAEVHAAMQVAHDAVDKYAHVIAIVFFGIKRGESLGQWKPLYQEWVDQFTSPRGAPIYPAAHPPTPPGLAARKLLLES